MKNNFIILGLLFLTLFISCKEKIEQKEEVKEIKNEFFSAEMSVIASKEDNFAMYYTEDGTINFNVDNALWSGVKGQLESQVVKFILPEDKIPTHIRFDFGMNKEQGDVTLEKFKLDYYGKSFEVKGSDFLKYFIQNDSIETEIDESKGTIKFLRGEKTYNTPFYYPHQLLLDEIAKLTN